jgi:ankyrin repeat protein
MIFCFFERFDTGTCSGRTPLHLSSYAGHLEVCHFLVEKGADVHASDSDLYDTFMIFHS